MSIVWIVGCVVECGSRFKCLTADVRVEVPHGVFIFA